MLHTALFETIQFYTVQFMLHTAKMTTLHFYTGRLMLYTAKCATILFSTAHLMLHTAQFAYILFFTAHSMLCTVKFATILFFTAQFAAKQLYTTHSATACEHDRSRPLWTFQKQGLRSQARGVTLQWWTIVLHGTTVLYCCSVLL